MSIVGLGEAFNFGKAILERIFPDPKQRQQAEVELLRLQQSGELAQLQSETQLALGQTEINKAEATSASLFVAGWRPAIGWCCGAIFACNYIGAPFLAWISPLLDIPPPPRLDIGEVLPVLLGMLGLGSLRSIDKKFGTA